MNVYKETNYVPPPHSSLLISEKRVVKNLTGIIIRVQRSPVQRKRSVPGGCLAQLPVSHSIIQPAIAKKEENEIAGGEGDTNGPNWFNEIAEQNNNFNDLLYNYHYLSSFDNQIYKI